MLEEYNKKLSKRGVGGLKKDEIREFTDLYRATSHHLAYARTHFGGSNIIVYLNQIISAGHNYMFVREKYGSSNFKYYFTNGFTNALKKNYKYMLTSFAVFMAGFLIFAAAVMLERSYGDIFFPNITASQLNLNPTGDDSATYPFLSAYITTNNIRVTFYAFSMGITAGIGTLYVLFYNGIMLGALTGIVISEGADILKFFAMILPHGFIELTAIFISGGAGLLVGKALLMPGNHKRIDAAVKAAKEAAYLIPGIAGMLVISGLIEGFFTPLGIHYIFKLAFAFATLVLMVLYFKGNKRRDNKAL